MRKVITIGESILDVLYRDGRHESSFAGGRIINIAASTASAGINTTVVSECGADSVGDIIVDYLRSHNVNTKSIDRFTDGTTALSMIFADGIEEKCVRYGKYPSTRFDVVWPRIDENDIIVFGSFYALDPNSREQLFEMITYAAERKAIIIYLPGFSSESNYRITKVMTAILENLETANLVIARDRDALNIFEDNDPQRVFKNRVAFYCPNYIQIDKERNLSLFCSKESTTRNNDGTEVVNSLSWDSGFCAGIIFGLITNNVTHSTINTIDTETWNNILKCAEIFAADAHATGTNCISSNLGEACRIELSNIKQEN